MNGAVKALRECSVCVLSLHAIQSFTHHLMRAVHGRRLPVYHHLVAYYPRRPVVMIKNSSVA